MPSLRPITRTMSTNPHTPFAKSAFSLSGQSGLYDRARPSYPSSALSKILSLLPPSPSILELGAGTGLFTRGLIRESKGLKGELIAVEPAQGMREGFEKKLQEMKEEEGELLKDVEVSIVDGTFEAIPVPDSSADLIVIAQAFHWIGHDGSSPLLEISRVLKPGGTLALIWNLEDRDTEWVARLRDVYEEFEAGTPQYRLGYWKSIFSLPFYAEKFSPPEILNFSRSLPTTDALALDRVLSKSYITSLPPTEKAAVVENCTKVLQEGKGKKWIEEKEGTFEYPYKTDLYLIKAK